MLLDLQLSGLCSYAFACYSLQIKKPIIEKRRRERINDSLNQLKALVLDSLQKDVSVFSVAFHQTLEF